MICLLCFAVAGLHGAFGSPSDAAPDFSSVSNAVIELLRNEDATRFAHTLVASADDWKAVVSTNVMAPGENPDKVIQTLVNQQFQKVESSAREFLDRVHSLDLNFTNASLNLRIIPPSGLGAIRYPSLQAEGQDLPCARKIEMTFAPGSTTNHLGTRTNPPAGDEFKLVVRGLMKFPGGWRSYGGIQWETIPPTAGGGKMAQETALLNKAEEFQGFTGADDPALLKFADVLIRFIREGDTNIYEKEALVTAEQVWDQYQRRGVVGGPTRQQIDEQVKKTVAEQMESAGAVVRQMSDAGIDLKNADIRIAGATVEHGQASSSSGSLDGMLGQHFQLKLEVKSTSTSKNGTPLSGVYVLAAPMLQRYGNEWKVEKDIHWSAMPSGILDATALAAMNLENFVGEHGILPPQTTVPEIEFITLDGEKKMKLSDLRGKIVVLDFWATWCGPCQDPMAHLQTLRQEYPDWKDKVAIVPLSIDDTIEQVRQHVQKRGWTNTFNVWAGEGGWQSTPVKTFRVRGVPTTYIIDADGKIIEAGHPAELKIGADVDRLLKTPAK